MTAAPSEILTARQSARAACPPNLHMSVTSPASDAPRLKERVEQKFFILPQREVMALALLQRTCRPDPLHPLDQVNSLYFDTFDLDQHERSDAGDFAKDKVRIRWYGQEHDPHETNGGADPSAVKRARISDTASEDVPVWLELKSRRGFVSTKQRLPLSVPPEALAFGALGRGILPNRVLAETVAGFGHFARGHLRPVIAISYWRLRFVEPGTGFRISIDSHIRSSVVMLGVGIGERGLELPGMVVEVKGPLFDVPLPLLPLAEIGSSWTRYSKYSSNLDAHAATRGGVSRLWPSGIMEKEPGVLAPVLGTVESYGSMQSPSRTMLVEDCETE